MNSARMKNAVLLLLAAVNAILACVFVWRIASASRAEARAARDGAAALEKLGFAVTAEQLAEKRPVLYTLERERDLAAEFAVAEKFIGEAEPLPQGGGIYIAETERGRVRISNTGTFELVLYAPYTEPITAGVSADALVDYARTAEAAESADGPVSTFLEGEQYLDGARIFGRKIEVTSASDWLTVTGGVILGDVYPSDGTHSKSLTAALLSLAGELSNDRSDTVETLLSAELGYTAALIAENYTELHPVWLIKTDLGEYFVDAVTLKLSY